MKDVEEHKLLQLPFQVLNRTYLVNYRWDCWIGEIEKGREDGVGKKLDEKWQRRTGDGGGSEENCGRKYGCHAKARAAENRGIEGGRKEGWRVEMMDALLSFCAP